MNKKLIAVIVALMIPLSFAETSAIPLGAQHPVPKVHIAKMALIGRGVAVNANDPSDFSELKIGVAKVAVDIGNVQKNVTAGLLFVDGTKYRLKNSVTGNGTFFSEIFENESVGTINMSSVIKNGRIMWYGECRLENKTYRVYIVEVSRGFQKSEMSDRLYNYCKENPSDENCKVLKNVKNYCESHPNDVRCQKLEYRYCIRHMDDSRCRAVIASKCKKNDECSVAISAYSKRFCSAHPEKCVNQIKKVKSYCQSHPNSVACKMFERKVVNINARKRKMPENIKEKTKHAESRTHINESEQPENKAMNRLKNMEKEINITGGARR